MVLAERGLEEGGRTCKGVLFHEQLAIVPHVGWLWFAWDVAESKDQCLEMVWEAGELLVGVGGRGGFFQDNGVHGLLEGAKGSN
jgi:hypothetical protein